MRIMTVSLNHTIVWSSDQTKSSRFFADMLDRPAPIRYGHFDVVKLDNGVSLDFARSEGLIQSQHYAFLIGEADFERSCTASASYDLSIGPTRCAAVQVRLTSMMVAAAYFSSRRFDRSNSRVWRGNVSAGGHDDPLSRSCRRSGSD